MKKLFLIIVLLGLFLMAAKIFAIPPWGENYRYSAYVHVYDEYGNPKPNIWVSLTVTAEDRITLQPLGGTVSGKTDANGYVVLNYYISWDYDPDLIDMMAYVSDSYYTAIQCSGNYTTTGNTLYPEFWVMKDLDQNGIADDYELPLAEKFCPDVCMHKNNPMIPSPVEILLDNTSLCYWLKPPDHTFFDIHYDKDRDEMSAQEAFELSKNLWDSDWWLDFGGKNAQRNVDYWHTYYNSIKDNYPAPTLYTHCFLDNEDVVIQYWFFYPYNAWCADHEGDWEHINVKVSSAYPDQAGPLEVVYYFHKKRLTLSWNNTWHNGNHPQVYVGGTAPGLFRGEESGGSYPWPGPWIDVAGTLEETIIPGRVINHSQFNLVNVTKNYNLWWMKFPGYWGVPCELICVDPPNVVRNAPRSPIHHECWEVYKHKKYSEYE